MFTWTAHEINLVYKKLNWGLVFNYNGNLKYTIVKFHLWII